MTTFIDAEEAAALLGYSRRQFLRKFVVTGMLKSMILPGKKAPKHRFVRAEVLKLIAASKGEG